MKKDILYDSKEAARFVTDVKGWVDIRGYYFGDTAEAEDMARYSSCTHRKCECGNTMSKSYSICDDCRNKNAIKRYNKLEKLEWNEEAPIYSEERDVYFNDLDELYCYIEEYSTTIECLRLLICRQTDLRHIDGDLFRDSLDDDIPDELYNAIDEFNNTISKIKTNTFESTNIAAIIT